MQSLFNKNKIFISVSFLLFTGLSILILFTDKGALHIAINNQHRPALDIFFKFITHLGSGWMVVILCVFFLFISFRFAIMMAVGNLFVSLVVHFLKRIVFPDVLRPKAWFEGIYDLYFVPGIQMHSIHSFPSGHAATAFSIFFFLSLLSDKPVWKFISVILAILTAFSRVYLSQHFMEDILMGSLTGLLFSFLVYYYFESKLPGKFEGSFIKLKR
jgi:membrane-associated phospholipid phosphatase